MPEKFALNIFEGAVTFRLYGEEEGAVEGKAKGACQRRLHGGGVSPLAELSPLPLLPLLSCPNGQGSMRGL